MIHFETGGFVMTHFKTGVFGYIFENLKFILFALKMKPEIQIHKKFWSVKVRCYRLVVLRKYGYFKLIHINIPTKFEVSSEFYRALRDWATMMDKSTLTSIYVLEKERRGEDLSMVPGRYFHAFFLHYYISWIYFHYNHK